MKPTAAFAALSCLWAGAAAANDRTGKLDNGGLVFAPNRAGPVGRFTPTVDKGDPTSLVSFWGKGTKKVGPTTFRMEMTDWVPGSGRELETLLLNSFGASQ